MHYKSKRIRCTFEKNKKTVNFDVFNRCIQQFFFLFICCTTTKGTFLQLRDLTQHPGENHLSNAQIYVATITGEKREKQNATKKNQQFYSVIK